MSGRISFIGAGPGAADLITVRGARRIAEADVVVWSASLVAPECVQEHARTDAELIDSSRLTHEQAVEIYRRAERDRINIARVHAGDPTLWGAVQDQYDVCSRMNVEVEIVAGVPAFSAAAASVGRELTAADSAQSLILGRLEGSNTSMPDSDKVREFARHGTTMALFLSAARTGQLVTELRSGGYADDVPVLIAYKVTCPDELVLRTTLGELEKTVKQHKLWRNTLFVVGRALSGGRARSRRTDHGHVRTYRRSGSGARRESHPRAADPATVPAPRGVRLDADVAWWAVRDWQESARNASRTAPRPSRFGVQAPPPAPDAQHDDTTVAEPEAAAPDKAPEPGTVDPADTTGIEESTATPEATVTAESSSAEAAPDDPRTEEPPTTHEHPAAEQSPAPDAAAEAPGKPKRTSSTGKPRSTAKAKTATKSKSAKSSKTNTTKPAGAKTARPSGTKSRSTNRDDSSG